MDGGGRVGRWGIHYSDTLKVTNFIFLIVGMVVMDIYIFFFPKKSTFQDLHYCKSKNQKLTLILERRFFFVEKTKAGKVGSQISCTVLKLDEAIITRVVVAHKQYFSKSALNA